MALPLGGQFELIMGAQLDQNGRPKVFRIDPTDASIAEEVLPDYLATITPQETRHGIEVRRWSAVRVTPETAALTEHATPVFVIARSLDVPTSQQWVQFLANIGAHARSAVTFHHVTCTTGSLHSMIVPASAVQVVGKRISADLAINHADVRFFSLNRL